MMLINLNVNETRLFEEINEHRIKSALVPVLALNQDLCEAAHYWSDRMAKENFFAHEYQGSTPSQRARDSGYVFMAIGETLAWSYPRDASETVLAWFNSPGHRQIMESRTYTDIGVGVVQDTDNQIFWTAVYGRPAVQPNPTPTPTPTPTPISSKPVINSVVPSSGDPGTIVTISGNNFGPAPGTVVFANATVRGEILAWDINGKHIKVRVPKEAFSGTLYVRRTRGGSDEKSDLVQFDVPGSNPSDKITDIWFNGNKWSADKEKFLITHGPPFYIVGDLPLRYLAAGENLSWNGKLLSARGFADQVWQVEFGPSSPYVGIAPVKFTFVDGSFYTPKISINSQVMMGDPFISLYQKIGSVIKLPIKELIVDEKIIITIAEGFNKSIIPVDMELLAYWGNHPLEILNKEPDTSTGNLKYAVLKIPKDIPAGIECINLMYPNALGMKRIWGPPIVSRNVPIPPPPEPDQKINYAKGLIVSDGMIYSGSFVLISGKNLGRSGTATWGPTDLIVLWSTPDTWVVKFPILSVSGKSRLTLEMDSGTVFLEDVEVIA